MVIKKPTYSFVHLNQVEILPLNTIIGNEVFCCAQITFRYYSIENTTFRLSLDIEVIVFHDTGLSIGTTNGFAWCRRQIRVKQENIYYSLTLWNEMVKICF